MFIVPVYLCIYVLIHGNKINTSHIKQIRTYISTFLNLILDPKYSLDNLNSAYIESLHDVHTTGSQFELIQQALAIEYLVSTNVYAYYDVCTNIGISRFLSDFVNFHIIVNTNKIVVASLIHI